MVSLTFFWYTLFSQTRKWRLSHSAITVSPRMEEMPSLNMQVQRLKVAILLLDLPCSRPVTRSEEISTTRKSHGKKPEGNTTPELAEGIMADLWRDVWKRETGTGQQVAQLHDGYMMMMMIMMMMHNDAFTALDRHLKCAVLLWSCPRSSFCHP